MKIQTKIQKIGAQAISEKDPMIILFGEEATESIAEVAVLQTWNKAEEVTLKDGDALEFGSEHYQIDFVGKLANENLNSIGHVTLIFEDVPDEDKLANGLYLTPHQLPNLTVGETITYIQK